MADDRALGEDDDPVGEVEQIFQVRADQHDAAAGVARGDQTGAHGARGVGIEAAIGIVRDDRVRPPIEFPSNHELLLISHSRPTRVNGPAARTSPSRIRRRVKSVVLRGSMRMPVRMARSEWQ